MVLVGGKQGNGYLLNRDQMPGSITRRPPCSDDSSTDLSLLAPNVQAHFGKRGPLSVFGPYTTDFGWYEFAKSRTTAAYFQDKDGNNYIIATGHTKEAESSFN